MHILYKILTKYIDKNIKSSYTTHHMGYEKSHSQIERRAYHHREGKEHFSSFMSPERPRVFEDLDNKETETMMLSSQKPKFVTSDQGPLKLESSVSTFVAIILFVSFFLLIAAYTILAFSVAVPPMINVLNNLDVIADLGAAILSFVVGLFGLALLWKALH